MIISTENYQKNPLVIVTDHRHLPNVNMARRCRQVVGDHLALYVENDLKEGRQSSAGSLLVSYDLRVRCWSSFSRWLECWPKCAETPSSKRPYG